MTRAYRTREAMPRRSIDARARAIQARGQRRKAKTAARKEQR